jgi:hypothetical protein
MVNPVPIYERNRQSHFATENPVTHWNLLFSSFVMQTQAPLQAPSDIPDDVRWSATFYAFMLSRPFSHTFVCSTWYCCFVLLVLSQEYWNGYNYHRRWAARVDFGTLKRRTFGCFVLFFMITHITLRMP